MHTHSTKHHIGRICDNIRQYCLVQIDNGKLLLGISVNIMHLTTVTDQRDQNH